MSGKRKPCPSCGKLVKSYQMHKRFCPKVPSIPMVQANNEAKTQRPYSDVDRICDMAKEIIGGTDPKTRDEQHEFVDRMRHELTLRSNTVSRSEHESLRGMANAALKQIHIIKNVLSLTDDLVY